MCIDLPLEVIQLIVNYLDHSSQINFILTCKLYNNVDITNMYVDMCVSSLLTYEYLCKYKNITKLNLYKNESIKTLSCFKYINELNIGMTSIGHEEIKHLNLEILNISNSRGEYDLSVFKNLKVLTINGVCNINPDDLKILPCLEKIYARFNPDAQKISNILINKNIKIIRYWQYVI